MRRILAIVFASAAFAANAQNEHWSIIKSPVPCSGYEGQTYCYQLMAPQDSVFRMTYDTVTGIEKLRGDTCQVKMVEEVTDHPAPDESPLTYHILKVIRCKSD